jgi:hypothetical protein
MECTRHVGNMADMLNAIFWSQQLKDKDHVAEVGVDVRIILKRTLMK